MLCIVSLMYNDIISEFIILKDNKIMLYYFCCRAFLPIFSSRKNGLSLSSLDRGTSRNWGPGTEARSALCISVYTI